MQKEKTIIRWCFVCGKLSELSINEAKNDKWICKHCSTEHRRPVDIRYE
jgi:formylmethanofuran dehydrogenase subunit E